MAATSVRKRKLPVLGTLSLVSLRAMAALDETAFQNGGGGSFGMTSANVASLIAGFVLVFALFLIVALAISGYESWTQNQMSFLDYIWLCVRLIVIVSVVLAVVVNPL